MPLIVEDGNGLSNAESYASVAEADSYFTARANEDWDNVEDKEAALRKATDYMLQNYRERWQGYRNSTTQALDWPRSQVEIVDAPSGYRSFPAYYATNYIPPEVKKACIELALIAGNQDLTPNLDRTTVQETVGPISVTYDTGEAPYQTYRKVDLWLSPFFCGSSSMSPLVRS